MADKHIASSGKRTETPRTESPSRSRRTPGGEGQAQKQTQPETPVPPRVASTPVGHSGIPVLPRLPRLPPLPRLRREDTSSSNDITPSTERSTHSSSTENSSHFSSSENSTRSDSGQESSGSGKADFAKADEQELSFREMVREGLADQGRLQPDSARNPEEKLDFFEFIRKENPPSQSKHKGSLKAFQLKKISLPVPWGEPRRATMESDRSHVAQPEADPAWRTLTPKAGRSADPRIRMPAVLGHAFAFQIVIVRMTRRTGFSGRALEPDFGQQAESMGVRSPRHRDDGKASVRPVPSMRRQDSGSGAQCFPGGFFTYRRAYQSDAQPQPTPSSRPDADKPQQDDSKARIDILIDAERKALTQRKKGQGGEMTEGHVRTFFRTDKPVVWKGQTLNAFKLVTEFVKPRLEGCEIGCVLQKSKSKVLKDEVLKEFAQRYLDGTNTILFVATENGKNAGNYALLKPYIDRVLKSLRPKDNAPATSCLPAEVRKFLLDMDGEIVKLCLESEALDIHAINQARTNAIISILFTRGLVPQIDIAAAQENSWERTLLTAFSTCLNSKLNLDSKSFLFSIIAEATEALPGDLRRQLAHRRAATVAKPTRFRDRGEQTGDRAPDTGRRPIPVGGLRATCGSMQMRASGVAAIRAKKQALKAFEVSLQLYKLAEPFLGQLRERLENLPAIDSTRQKLCQAVLDYIPIYIDQLKANPAAPDTASFALEVKSLLKLQAALQEEVAPAATVELSTAVQPALQEEGALSETARSSSAELDAPDHISSPTLTREDSQAESDDREAPLPAPEEKEKEKS